jgi:hypothetical protein
MQLVQNKSQYVCSNIYSVQLVRYTVKCFEYYSRQLICKSYNIYLSYWMFSRTFLHYWSKSLMTILMMAAASNSEKSIYYNVPQESHLGRIPKLKEKHFSLPVNAMKPTTIWFSETQEFYRKISKENISLHYVRRIRFIMWYINRYVSLKPLCKSTSEPRNK